MVSKVYAFFLNEEAQTKPGMDAFRSCAQGSGVGGAHIGHRPDRVVYKDATANAAITVAHVWTNQPGILSYQF